MKIVNKNELEINGASLAAYHHHQIKDSPPTYISMIFDYFVKLKVFIIYKAN